MSTANGTLTEANNCRELTLYRPLRSVSPKASSSQKGESTNPQLFKAINTSRTPPVFISYDISCHFHRNCTFAYDAEMEWAHVQLPFMQTPQMPPGVRQDMDRHWLMPHIDLKDYKDAMSGPITFCGEAVEKGWEAVNEQAVGVNVNGAAVADE